jgi:hypothetical protein
LATLLPSCLGSGGITHVSGPTVFGERPIAM